jgi:hypothetical protein
MKDETKDFILYILDDFFLYKEEEKIQLIDPLIPTSSPFISHVWLLLW